MLNTIYPLRSLTALKVVVMLSIAFSVPYSFGASCHIVQHGEPSEADKALLAADFARAELLYRDALKARPDEVTLHIGLVHALLRQQKLQQASDAANMALAAAPQDASLIALRGEVEYRQGAPWSAGKSADEARKLDPCNVRAILLSARLARLASMFATSKKLIRDAHLLDPQDPDARLLWINTLPLKERAVELDAYILQSNGKTEDELRRMRLAAEHWKKLLNEPHKSCHLVSNLRSTETSFVRPNSDSSERRKFDLEVQLNNRSTRLGIDTGSTGLIVTEEAAKRAGLKAFSQAEVGGVGDDGNRTAYTAFADSVRIGGLEFQDCAVGVLKGKYVPGDSDGFIGMDVFSNFLVTLDFPMRKLKLDPLPPRPGETTGNAPELLAHETNPDGKDNAAEPHDRYIAPEMKDYTRVYRVRNDLILPASLNEQKMSLFILDTGAWSTVISPEAAREVTKVRDNYSTRLQGVSGTVNKVYSADSVTFRFANLSQKTTGVLSIDMSNVSQGAGMEISGFLGATTLKQLTMHIDYRDGLVKFDYDPKHGYY